MNFVDRVMERIGAERRGRLWVLPEEFRDEFGDSVEEGDEYAAALIALRLSGFGRAEGRREFSVECVNCSEEIIGENVEAHNLIAIGLRVEYRHIRMEEEVLEFLYDPESGRLLDFSALRGLEFRDVGEEADVSLIRKAVEAAMDVVRERAEKVERRAQEEARRDVQRVREYYERMIAEEEEEIRGLIRRAEEYEAKMFSARRGALRERYDRLRLKALEKATELMNALERKKEEYRRRVEEYERREVEKARVKAEIYVEGALEISVPRVKRISRFVGRGVERVERYEYDHLKDELTLKCRCGAELREAYLTAEGFLVCRSCYRECAACGRPMSIYEPHRICASCGAVLCEAHSFRCATCRRSLCEEHSIKCEFCSARMCEEHVRRCEVCGAEICEEHTYECAVCGISICPAHVSRCEVCGGDVCPEHGRRCYICGKYICDSCAEKVDGKTVCREHVAICASCGRKGIDMTSCEICGASLCAEHASTCDVCGKKLCEKHVARCASCGRPLCPEHTVRCSICQSALCEEHLHECEVCGSPLCDAHSITCPTCGSTLCPSHGKDGRCPICSGSREVKSHPLIPEIVRKYPYAARGRGWRVARSRRALILITRVRGVTLAYRVDVESGEIQEVRSR